MWLVILTIWLLIGGAVLSYVMHREEMEHGYIPEDSALMRFIYQVWVWCWPLLLLLSIHHYSQETSE